MVYVENDAPSAMLYVEPFALWVDFFYEVRLGVGQCIGEIGERTYLFYHFVNITDCVFWVADCYDVVSDFIHV